MTSMTKPGSRVTRTLQAVAAQGGECTTREFLRIIKTINDGARYDALAEDLRVRGFIERRVVLTAKGRAALGGNDMNIKPKLTPWIDGRFYPAIPCVYGRQFGARLYSKWTGSEWLVAHSHIAFAANSVNPSYIQSLNWRGRAEKP